MAIRARLTFKEHVPFRVEHMLCTERGFHVAHRMNGGGIILQKGYADNSNGTPGAAEQKPPGLATQLPWEEAWVDHNSDSDPKTVGEIPMWRIAELEKRCDRICNTFIDPYSQSQQVRDQIITMCRRTHVSPIEQEWIENWIYANVL